MIYTLALEIKFGWLQMSIRYVKNKTLSHKHNRHTYASPSMFHNISNPKRKNDKHTEKL